jgi:hypothetical protein
MAGSLLVDYSLPDYCNLHAHDSAPGLDSLPGHDSLPANDSDVGDFRALSGMLNDSPSIPHHPVKTFTDYAALEASVRAHCQTHGYEIAIVSAKKQGHEKWISCAKGVKRKLKTESKIKKGSKITGCPFTMRWSLVEDSTTAWHLTYPRGIAKDHNHGPTDTSKLANLRRSARKDTTLSEYVAVLRTAGIPAKQIKAAAKLQFAHVAIPLTSTDFRNEIDKQRRAELAASSPLNPT